MIKNDDFINSLLSCNNIKYHNFGRNEFGLDCVGLPVFALKKIGHNFYDDLEHYSLKGDGYTLTNILSKNCYKKNTNELKKGDILVARFFMHPQHILIFLGNYKNDNKEYVIHASSLKKCVIIEDFNIWKDKVVGAFTLKCIE